MTKLLGQHFRCPALRIIVYRPKLSFCVLYGKDLYCPMQETRTVPYVNILVPPVLSCLTWCDSLDKRVYRDGIGSRGLPLSMRGFCLQCT